MYFKSISNIVYDDVYCLADNICNLSESSFYSFSDESLNSIYNLLIEDLGNKYNDRVMNMAINHRNRDADISNNEVLKSQIPIYSDLEKLEDKQIMFNRYTDKKIKEFEVKRIQAYKEYLKLADSVGTKDPKFLKKEKELHDLEKKYYEYINDCGISKEEYLKLQKKYNIITVNSLGGLINKGLIKIDGISPAGNSNVYETMHYKRNQRIMAAIRRLEKYLEKKDFTPEKYAKEHDKMIGTKVNPSRKRLKQRSPHSVNKPVENYEVDPDKPWIIRRSSQQYRDDGTLR